MAVCDANYGYITSQNQKLKNVSINMKSSLACVWNKQNENPLIPELFGHFKNFCQTS